MHPLYERACGLTESIIGAIFLCYLRSLRVQKLLEHTEVGLTDRHHAESPRQGGWR